MKTLVSYAGVGRGLVWLARVLALLTLGILLLFMVGEGFNPARLQPRDLLLSVFFPLGLMAGLVLGWWCPRVGGIVSLASLGGFYLVHLLLSGRFPRGPAFAVLAVPALIFVLGGLLAHGWRPAASGSR